MQNTHLTLEEIALHCGGQMPLPVDSGSGNGTVFAEPWQAHAFAMTVARKGIVHMARMGRGAHSRN